MTKEEFRDYVTHHDCTITPVDGINQQGRSVKIVNRRFKGNYYYLSLPLDDREMPDNEVSRACRLLAIPDPFDVSDIDVNLLL